MSGAPKAEWWGKPRTTVKTYTREQILSTELARANFAVDEASKRLRRVPAVVLTVAFFSFLAGMAVQWWLL